MDILNRSAANLRSTFTELTYEKFIRIVIVVGAYALLRPYLLKITGRSQMAQHTEANEEAAKAEISPNSLRGQVDIPEDSDDEGVEGAATGADWGKKARRRQREVLKMMMDAEEERLAQEQEDEEDKDIEEFLIKE
ncbi:hypothetical protein VD0002_g6175 [Verticillium dahliae]|uniref:Uncharacterized protein n=3 Tax=Verticillium TaxID=1036719 RepID=G2WU61_VERDV|nr:uncharacterized protein VDAG_01334 [Verticillium dahliae VdLs.17]KAF3348338.1 ADP-ribosylation factor GTPase-activating protein GCS1 [Verticillium dahliae VDG2]KAF3359210.1 hypothetical protein VdG1_02233 [Verticillium dahliae VDG1]KAG7106651.1 Processing of GAS1 and ALP protein 2 like [Verticillium longisporum]KAH6690880.1 protein trafficking Pga2 [Verticillium dahliae]EGY17652.1 hypothetical protein VDAG_01334 [Verticillium dahliae VdLs.17]